MSTGKRGRGAWGGPFLPQSPSVSARVAASAVAATRCHRAAAADSRQRRGSEDVPGKILVLRDIREHLADIFTVHHGVAIGQLLTLERDLFQNTLENGV